jgi:hypothetical protein
MSTFPAFTVKAKTCTAPGCDREFIPARPLQAVCSQRCAKRKVLTAKREKEAREKAELKARKRALETIPQLTKAAQREFNKFVRMRDAHQPCISCGSPPPDLSQLHAGRDAGHYRSVGSAAHLRFHEDNCHAQCVKCNQWGAGRAVDYRLGLVARIGLPRIEALEADNAVKKWTREELRGIAANYRAKRKELEQT